MLKSIKGSAISYAVYIVWMIVAAVLNAPVLVIILPLIIEFGVRILAFVAGCVFIWFKKPAKGVWEILDKTKYTEEGIFKIEHMYANVQSIQQKITDVEMEQLYNDLDENLHELLDVIGYAATHTLS